MGGAELTAADVPPGWHQPPRGPRDHWSSPIFGGGANAAY
jgi:hypothetical protein